MANNPAPPSPQLMRDDMQAMLSFIQGARIVSIARETAISRLKGWLVGRMWLGVVTALLALYLAWLFGWGPKQPLDGPLIAGLVLIVLASRIGAIISISRRINDDALGAPGGGDSIFTLASLGSGRNGLALALLSSNAFGLVLFALFASGIPGALGLTGGIAPSFRQSAAELRVKAQAAVALVSDQQKMVDTLCSDGALAAKQQPTTTPTSTPSAPTTPTTPTPTTAPAGGKAGDGKLPATVPPADLNTPAVKCAGARLLLTQAQDRATALTAQATAATNARLPVDGWFDQLASALGLVAASDLFKMLIWAFIAGFFEQFVPDMLDTIANRTKASQQQAGTAAAK